MIWNIHLGSQIPVNGSGFFPTWVPDERVKKAPDPGSGTPTLTLIPKIVFFSGNNFKKEYSGVTTQFPPSYPPPPTL